MPPVQGATDYTINHGAGYRGQVADEQNKEIVSGVAETATVIESGLAVIRGATDRSVKVPDGAGIFRGVVVRNMDAIGADSSSPISYESGEELPLLTKGIIFVELSDTVVVDGAVFFDNVGASAGTFRSDVTGATAIAGATYLDAGVTGEIVRIRIPSAVA